MKLAIGVAVVIWFLCGVTGAWWLDDLHWKPIANGPITLVKAFSERPVTSPTP